MSDSFSNFASIERIHKAGERLKGVAVHTPLQKNKNLSEAYACSLWLKREDLQLVRSYKLRGAYNMISAVPEAKNGVVCASAGNHAQGVAYSCSKLGIQGTIFMPATTPKQKIHQVKMFGKEFIEVRLVGDTFDDAYAEAIAYAENKKLTFVHPFDHPLIVEGQATVGIEILADMQEPIDYLIVPVGGGGLVSGLISWFKVLSPDTKIIGVEPEGAPAMLTSLEAGLNTPLATIDKFVDGAAVKRVGDLNFAICKDHLDQVILVPEGKVCSTIIKLYNEEAIVVEPAGSLAIAALDFMKDKIKGKNVICVVTGSNNDLGRMDEIKERSLLYEGLKHYFIINFPQRAGALREFLDQVLGPNDDITRFEYTKKNMKEYGPALVGIELKNKEDYSALIDRMEKKGIVYLTINSDPNLFNYFL
ncbi:MAG: threonine ammonia-lyase IlvA [Cytophagaceae bacterium]|nr:threonine ammonia-lyase IlvA [Cytophagaceae bacterium]